MKTDLHVLSPPIKGGVCEVNMAVSTAGAALTPAVAVAVGDSADRIAAKACRLRQGAIDIAP
jgi:hypothetical protein